MQRTSGRPLATVARAACACLWLGVYGSASSAAPGPGSDTVAEPILVASGPTVGSSASASQAAARAPLPANAVGDLWLTTSHAGDLMRSRQIARAADGSYVAVRDNQVGGQSTGDGAVFMRRLDQTGNALGEELLVARGLAPGVATFGDGSFVVTWLAPPPAAFSLTVPVMGQLFDRVGAPVGAPLTLGETAGTATPTSLADGTFVLATYGNFSRVNGPSSYLRTYTREGTEFGPIAQLHEDACGTQGPPAVAALPAGGYAVAWPWACVSAPQVRTRVYGANGALNASSRMTVGTQGDTATVGLTTLSSGNVALQWSLGTPAALRELHTLVVAPAAPPQSAVGAVNVPLQPGRKPGSVQALADGGFVIPWSASNQGDARVPVSRFSSAGVPL